MNTSSAHHPVVLITGAAGMLGRALQRELLAGALTPAELRLLDVAPASADSNAPVAARTRWLTVDVRDAAALQRACAGVDLVFHSAALVDLGDHPAELVHAINVDGTRNVIDACRAAGVRALVHTSSEDVVYGGEPICDGDESLPYPLRFGSLYCETKAQGEQLALAAHDPPALRCCVLRPVGLYGEGDPYHLSSLLEAAIGGVLPRMGDGSARFSHAYVGNVAHAHVLAGRALLDGDGAGVAIGGRPFFVTDSAPANFFDFFAPILRQLGVRLTPRWLGLPYRPLRWAGAANELIAGALAPWVRRPLSLSRFAVDLICRDFSFRGDALAQHLGYRPRYSEAQAHANTVAYFRCHGVRPRPALA